MTIFALPFLTVNEGLMKCTIHHLSAWKHGDGKGCPDLHWQTPGGQANYVLANGCRKGAVKKISKVYWDTIASAQEELR